MPWAVTDNGDYLFYDAQNNLTIVRENGAWDDETETYEMGIVEFLYKWLSKDIKCDSLPELVPTFKGYGLKNQIEL